MQRKFIPALSAIVGALAITASGASMARDRFDIADTTWSTAVEAAPMQDAQSTSSSSAGTSVYTSERLSNWYHTGPLTREQVKADLRAARDAGALSNGGEAGDTERVIAARDKLNSAQADAIVAEYQAIEQRILAQQEADRQLALAALAAEEPVGSDAVAAQGEAIDSSMDAQSSLAPEEVLIVEPSSEAATVAEPMSEPVDAPTEPSATIPNDAVILPPSTDEATSPDALLYHD